MRVRLINIDSKLPNLALMQISSYHKSLGDEVGFDVENPDKVYISCLFSKNRSQALGVSTYYSGCDVSLGGSGIDLVNEIPEPARKIYPDYSLYPDIDYSYGFTTRGCIRSCKFCIVPQKEGYVHRHNHIKDFYNPKFKKVVLLDNNIYSLKDWFFENTDFIIDRRLSVDITQGMDIRLLTSDIAEQLSRMKFIRSHLHFAFDDIRDKKSVVDGVHMLVDAGINPRNVSFYVLTGYNSTHEQDLERCNIIRDLGCTSFVMQYKPDSFTKLLARWANKTYLYCNHKFEDDDKYVQWRKKYGTEY